MALLLIFPAHLTLCFRDVQLFFIQKDTDIRLSCCTNGDDGNFIILYISLVFIFHIEPNDMVISSHRFRLYVSHKYKKVK